VAGQADKVAVDLRGLVPLAIACGPLAVEVDVALHVGTGVGADGGYRLHVRNKPGDLFRRHYRHGVASCSQSGVPMAPVTHGSDLTTTGNEPMPRT
jgi:hypothetical protein